MTVVKIPNTRFGASRNHEEIEDLIAHRVAEEIEARKATMNLESLNENVDEQEGGNGNGGNRGNRGNGNRGNGGNGNRGNGENGKGYRNMNHGQCLNLVEDPQEDNVNDAYVMNWAGLIRLITEVYCMRNEIQKMETELWNLTVKGNDLTGYTQKFKEL
ncbi:hypothetical protein Tco_1348212, partial [Tanacetum coccineum]